MAFAAFQTGMVVIGQLTPVCKEIMPGFHDADCECDGRAARRCRKPMTKWQFLLDGRCTDCMNTEKRLAKEPEEVARRLEKFIKG